MRLVSQRSCASNALRMHYQSSAPCAGRETELANKFASMWYTPNVHSEVQSDMRDSTIFVEIDLFAVRFHCGCDQICLILLLRDAAILAPHVWVRVVS